MKKYWTIFKLNLQRSFEYRAEFVFHMALGLVTFVVTVFVFKAIFKVIDNFAGYTFSAIFTYLLMTKFLHPTIRWNTSRQIADEIKEGGLSTYLLKPANYLKHWFSIFSADRFFDILIRFFLLALFAVIFPSFFVFPSLGRFFLFLLFLLLALFLNFLFNLSLALFAFWVTDVRLFSTMIDLVVGFLAGAILPIDAFPHFLKNIAAFLPFQYVLYFPIKLFQGMLTFKEVWQGAVIIFLWIGIISVVLNYLWKNGLKNYEAIGQ